MLSKDPGARVRRLKVGSWEVEGLHLSLPTLMVLLLALALLLLQTCYPALLSILAPRREHEAPRATEQSAGGL